MGRREDALEAVNESLREKQCAIVHKDDIFTDAEQRMWDEAREFVERFAYSAEAMEFEKSFHSTLQDNLEFNRGATAKMDELNARLKECDDKVEQLQAEFESARSSIFKKGLLEKKTALVEAKVAAKAARVEMYNTRKQLQIDKKARNTVFKPYIFNEVHWRGKRLEWKDPSVLLGTAPTLLEIAGTYYSEPAKVRIPTLWRVCAIPPGCELPSRMGSQLWHRDQGDARMLKAFAYFSDVDEGSGALDYIPSSLPKDSRWAEAIPLLPTSGYPSQDLVQELVPQDEIFRCIGRTGTIAFVDTAGLHRGGFATSGPRITVQTTYLREKTTLPKTPLIHKAEERPTSLSESQYWALS